MNKKRMILKPTKYKLYMEVNAKHAGCSDKRIQPISVNFSRDERCSFFFMQNVIYLMMLVAGIKVPMQ